VLAAIVRPPAEAAIPVFVASTSHADLVLVPEQREQQAVIALEEAGHQWKAGLARPGNLSGHNTSLLKIKL
jgi:hypothetical protein